jgi:hypothetical protein
MTRLLRTTGLAGHVLVCLAAVWAVVLATSHVTYSPLRRAMIVMAAVLAVVSLLGRLTAPVADSVAARAIRGLGFVLAGLAVWGVVVEFWFDGDPSQLNPAIVERAGTGIPMGTAVFAIYFVAFLVWTRRGSTLQPRTLVESSAVAFGAVAVWALAVVALPPANVGLAFLFIVGAVVAAAAMARRHEASGTAVLQAALVTTVVGTQTLISVADVMFHLGPDRWLPYAGPGPIGPEAQLAQNRVEAIDPYVGLLVLGALAVVGLVVTVLLSRALARAEPAGEGAPA